jgi:hypothetical protein
MDPDSIIIRRATEADAIYAPQISAETERSAVARGTGISKRTPESIIQKMTQGKAIIALTTTGQWVGFSYIEVWSNGEFVSNSGLIVDPAFRKNGVATAIKEKTFALARKKYPQAKIFSITTALAIMKLNMQLGFQPVTFNELPKDEVFWKGCSSCVNYGILQSKEYKNCLCTAMLFMPAPLHSSDRSSCQYPLVNGHNVE